MILKIAEVGWTSDVDWLGRQLCLADHLCILLSTVCRPGFGGR